MLVEKIIVHKSKTAGKADTLDFTKVPPKLQGDARTAYYELNPEKVK